MQSAASIHFCMLTYLLHLNWVHYWHKKQLQSVDTQVIWQ